jgi:hypothetical protein
VSHLEVPMLAQNPPPDLQSKMLEYQLCTTDANHLESVIWTTAGILITGSVAGIGFLGGTLPKDPTFHDILFRVGVAALFVVLIWFWKRIVARWYSLQQILYARICELEAELSLYKERYIHWLTEYSRDGTLPADEQGQRAMLRLRPLYVSISVRKTVGWLANTLVVVWLLFIALHIVAMATLR